MRYWLRQGLSTRQTGNGNRILHTIPREPTAQRLADVFDLITLSIAGFSPSPTGKCKFPVGKDRLVQKMVDFDEPSQDTHPPRGCPVAELLVRFVKVGHLLKFQDEYLKPNDLPS